MIFRPAARVLNTIVRLRCPYCHNGQMFRHPFGMNDACPNCAREYGGEPGYFIGAMYLSYAFVALAVGIGVLTLFLLESPRSWYVPILTGVVMIVGPMTWAASRVAWVVIESWFTEMADGDEVAALTSELDHDEIGD